MYCREWQDVTANWIESTEKTNNFCTISKDLVFNPFLYNAIKFINNKFLKKRNGTRKRRTIRNKTSTEANKLQ